MNILETLFDIFSLWVRLQIILPFATLISVLYNVTEALNGIAQGIIGLLEPLVSALGSVSGGIFSGITSLFGGGSSGPDIGDLPNQILKVIKSILDLICDILRTISDFLNWASLDPNIYAVSYFILSFITCLMSLFPMFSAFLSDLPFHLLVFMIFVGISPILMYLNYRFIQGKVNSYAIQLTKSEIFNYQNTDVVLYLIFLSAGYSLLCIPGLMKTVESILPHAVFVNLEVVIGTVVFFPVTMYAYYFVQFTGLQGSLDQTRFVIKSWYANLCAIFNITPIDLNSIITIDPNSSLTYMEKLFFAQLYSDDQSIFLKDGAVIIPLPIKDLSYVSKPNTYDMVLFSDLNLEFYNDPNYHATIYQDYVNTNYPSGLMTRIDYICLPYSLFKDQHAILQKFRDLIVKCLGSPDNIQTLSDISDQTLQAYSSTGSAQCYTSPYGDAGCWPVDATSEWPDILPASLIKYPSQTSETPIVTPPQTVLQQAINSTNRSIASANQITASNTHALALITSAITSGTETINLLTPQINAIVAQLQSDQKNIQTELDSLNHNSWYLLLKNTPGCLSRGSNQTGTFDIIDNTVLNSDLVLSLIDTDVNSILNSISPSLSTSQSGLQTSFDEILASTPGQSTLSQISTFQTSLNREYVAASALYKAVSDACYQWSVQIKIDKVAITTNGNTYSTLGILSLPTGGFAARIGTWNTTFTQISDSVMNLFAALILQVNGIIPQAITSLTTINQTQITSLTKSNDTQTSSLVTLKGQLSTQQQELIAITPTPAAQYIIASNQAYIYNSVQSLLNYLTTISSGYQEAISRLSIYAKTYGLNQVANPNFNMSLDQLKTYTYTFANGQKQLIITNDVSANAMLPTSANTALTQQSYDLNTLYNVNIIGELNSAADASSSANLFAIADTTLELVASGIDLDYISGLYVNIRAVSVNFLFNTAAENPLNIFSQLLTASNLDSYATSLDNMNKMNTTGTSTLESEMYQVLNLVADQVDPVKIQVALQSAPTHDLDYSVDVGGAYMRRLFYDAAGLLDDIHATLYEISIPNIVAGANRNGYIPQPGDPIDMMWFRYTVQNWSNPLTGGIDNATDNYLVGGYHESVAHGNGIANIMQAFSDNYANIKSITTKIAALLDHIVAYNYIVGQAQDKLLLGTSNNFLLLANRYFQLKNTNQPSMSLLSLAPIQYSHFHINLPLNVAKFDVTQFTPNMPLTSIVDLGAWLNQASFVREDYKNFKIEVASTFLLKSLLDMIWWPYFCSQFYYAGSGPSITGNTWGQKMDSMYSAFALSLQSYLSSYSPQSHLGIFVSTHLDQIKQITSAYRHDAMLGYVFWTNNTSAPTSVPGFSSLIDSYNPSLMSGFLPWLANNTSIGSNMSGNLSGNLSSPIPQMVGYANTTNNKFNALGADRINLRRHFFADPMSWFDMDRSYQLYPMTYMTAPYGNLDVSTGNLTPAPNPKGFDLTKKTLGLSYAQKIQTDWTTSTIQPIQLQCPGGTGISPPLTMTQGAIDGMIGTQAAQDAWLSNS